MARHTSGHPYLESISLTKQFIHAVEDEEKEQHKVGDATSASYQPGNSTRSKGDG
jgi:hypothetical protein